MAPNVGPEPTTLRLRVSCPSNSTVTVANGATELVDGESEVSIRLGNQNKNLSVRLLNSLAYDCIFGMYFLKLFGFEIDFATNSWRCSGIKNYCIFNQESIQPPP